MGQHHHAQVNMRDSVTQVDTILSPVPYSTDVMQLIRVGQQVTVTGQISLKSSFDGVTNLRAGEPPLPPKFRPAQHTTGTIMFMGNNSQQFNIRISSDGIMRISGSGSVGYYFSILGDWVTE